MAQISSFCVSAEHGNNNATKNVTDDDASHDNEDRDEVLEILWLKVMASSNSFQRIIGVIH